MKVIVLAALIPMATGPLPQDERTLTMSICGGGEITIPLGNKGGKQKRDCHQQGCHAGASREKLKPRSNVSE